MRKLKLDLIAKSAIYIICIIIVGISIVKFANYIIMQNFNKHLEISRFCQENEVSSDVSNKCVIEVERGLFDKHEIWVVDKEGQNFSNGVMKVNSPVILSEPYIEMLCYSVQKVEWLENGMNIFFCDGNFVHYSGYFNIR